MRYFCLPDDDDFDFFDDSGDEQDEEFYEDEDEEEIDEESFEDDTSAEEEDPYEEAEDDDSALPEIDDRAFASAEDFPNAEEADFDDDPGTWSDADYSISAENLFGDHPFFGDTLSSQLTADGFRAFTEPAFYSQFDQLAPGAGDTVHLFERDGRLHAFGFLPIALLSLLQSRYTGIDWSPIQVSVPGLDYPRPESRPLPEPFASAPLRDAVDLRPYCTPVADQRQTSRCSAFAWTHATEMAHRILQANVPRLSANYTMLQFQQMQGDARSYRYAYTGGDGTIGGPDPGHVLAQEGTCQQRLWPDDAPEPMADERFLAHDASQHRLPARPWPIAIDDVKRALSAGCPVHLAMNTGPRFSEVGRDGLVNAAEAPSGEHGRHAMLLVGYTGNYYIVKNSWGTSWGDGGYCYIPKKVLAESDSEFVAVLLDRKQN